MKFFTFGYISTILGIFISLLSIWIAFYIVNKEKRNKSFVRKEMAKRKKIVKLAKEFILLNNYTDAIEILKKYPIEDFKSRNQRKILECYFNIIDIFYKDKKLDNLKEVLYEIQLNSLDKKNLKIAIDKILYIIDLLTDKKRIENAFEVLMTLPEDKRNALCYRKLSFLSQELELLEDSLIYIDNAINMVNKLKEEKFYGELCAIKADRLYRLNHFTEAIKYIDISLCISNSPKNFAIKGIILHFKGDYNVAEDCLLKSFNERNDWIHILIILAQNYREKQEYKKSLETYTLALNKINENSFLDDIKIREHIEKKRKIISEILIKYEKTGNYPIENNNKGIAISVPFNIYSDKGKS